MTVEELNKLKGEERKTFLVNSFKPLLSILKGMGKTRKSIANELNQIDGLRMSREMLRRYANGVVDTDGNNIRIYKELISMCKKYDTIDANVPKNSNQMSFEKLSTPTNNGFFMNSLNDFMESVQEEKAPLMIITDFVIYGIFSQTKAFNDYFKKLLDIASQAKVTIIIPTKKFQKERLVQQINNERAKFYQLDVFKRFLKNTTTLKVEEQYRCFLKNEKNNHLELEPEELAEFFIEVDTYHLNELKKSYNVLIKRYNGSLPVFLWRSPTQKQTVFSITHENFKIEDLNFLCNGGDLIFESIWKEFLSHSN